MHEVLVNRLGGLSLHRKSVVRLTDRPDMTLDVYRGRKTTIQLCITTTTATTIKNELQTIPYLSPVESYPTLDQLVGKFAIKPNTSLKLKEISLFSLPLIKVLIGLLYFFVILLPF